MPADMSLRLAMQQQDWITAAALNKVDYSFLSFDLLTSETIKHGVFISVFQDSHNESCRTLTLSGA
jgi:hypothetical protein